MARPLKINANYFSHDNTMRNNRKILALRAKFGHLGYSIWNMFLEILTESNYSKIELDEQELILLAGDFQSKPEEIKEVLEFCIQIRLLHKEDNTYWSENLVERLSWILDFREKNKQKMRVVRGNNEVVTGNNEVVSVIESNRIESNHYLLGLGINHWNKRAVWPSGQSSPANSTTLKKLLPACRKETPDIVTAWNKIKPCEEDWDIAIKAYVLEIANRNPNTDYANHRFSFYEFIKQVNGYKKYLNK